MIKIHCIVCRKSLKAVQDKKLSRRKCRCGAINMILLNTTATKVASQYADR